MYKFGGVLHLLTPIVIPLLFEYAKSINRFSTKRLLRICYALPSPLSGGSIPPQLPQGLRRQADSEVDNNLPTFGLWFRRIHSSRLIYFSVEGTSSPLKSSPDIRVLSVCAPVVPEVTSTGFLKHTHTSGLEAWNDMPIFDRCCSAVTRPTELVSLESPLICAIYVDAVHLVHIVILR